MDFGCSPHREGGGTVMHLPSPTHRHGFEIPSTLQQIRRSLSRSPSKPSRFHSSRWPDSSGSPISPLALSRAYSPKGAYAETKPLFPETPFASLPKKRFQLRRSNNPVRSSPRNRNPSKSPRRRALTESTDQGNAPPSIFAMRLTAGEENAVTRRSSDLFENTVATEQRPSMRLFDDIDDKPIKFDISLSRDPPTPAAPSKSTTLKRSDDAMNFPASNVGTPLAKRRSVQGPSTNNIDVFDQSHTPHTPAEESSRPFKLDFSNSNPFSPGPAHTPLRKSLSLKKNILSQRQGLNVSQPKPTFDGDFALPGAAASQSRPPISLDGSFGAVGSHTPVRRPSFSDASRQPYQHGFFRPAVTTTQPHQPHPLSHALSPTFSTPSKEDDVDMDGPVPAPAAPPRHPGFSKSLPLGAARPFLFDPSTDTLQTPNGFRIPKPDPSAFMSTGLMSKKNRLVDEETAANRYVMPDTPSKRYTFPPVTVSPSTNRRSMFQDKIKQPLFGQPTTPFSQHKPSSSASFGRNVNIFGSTNNLRRSSFASVDGDDNSQWPFEETNPDSPLGKHLSDSQSSHEDSLPPTPTKASDPCGRRKDSSLRRHAFRRGRSSLGADTFADPTDYDASIIDFEDSVIEDASPARTATPHTPLEGFAPPDASFLSISGQRRGSLPFNTSRNSEMLPPATPTTPRDITNLFKSSLVSVAPVVKLTDNDVDQSLAERFDTCVLWGDGEFSKVYRAEKAVERSPGFFAASPRRPRVYAVKKTKKPYAGPADRAKKMKEVDVLRALRGHEHIVCYEDHWEHNNHLYIQTEFCEEGNLQRFLATAGNKGRLDSFRIWKILSEITAGISFMHESGYIHLDLKPANILITFDGVLKIADFGLATSWPVGTNIDGEGDRHYLAPEALCGRYDKPCDIFALGVIMCEVAGNLEMPENGESWQKLRSGDFSELPSLTWSSESTLDRDVNGDPLDLESGDTQIEHLFASATDDDIQKAIMPALRYKGGLASPPNFMIDDSDPQSLHQMVQSMMNPNPDLRPTVEQIYGCQGCQWVQGRSRAGATIFEGNWGPADDVLDHHMITPVEELDRMDMS